MNIEKQNKNNNSKIFDDKISRRSALSTGGKAAAGVAVLSLAGLGYTAGQLSSIQQTNSNITKDLDKKSYLLDSWLIYGGGSNIKKMPNIVDKSPNVNMDEVFYFNHKSATCRVDNNPEPFIMPSYKLGEIVVEPNTFYMVMTAQNLVVKSIQEFDSTSEFSNTCVLESYEGVCFTEASVDKQVYGSRIAPEPFTSEITAVDATSFAFTAYFDETTAPVNFAIFGPKFIFTGALTSGSVVVKKLSDASQTLPRKPINQ